MKVGDRVKIIPGTRYYRVGDDYNPKDLEGTIAQFKNGYIEVIWDNGCLNSYCEDDLEVVTLEGKIINSYQIY